MLKFYCLCGIPASGKSTFANNIREKEDAVIICPDSIREELYGDPSIQGNGKEVFDIAYKRILENLRHKKNVIFDATNIHYKDRKKILSLLKEIKCFKICVFFPSTIDESLERQKNRYRKVPKEVIERMFINLSIPQYTEGWNSVITVDSNNETTKRIIP